MCLKVTGLDDTDIPDVFSRCSDGKLLGVCFNRSIFVSLLPRRSLPYWTLTCIASGYLLNYKVPELDPQGPNAR